MYHQGPGRPRLWRIASTGKPWRLSCCPRLGADEADLRAALRALGYAILIAALIALPETLLGQIYTHESAAPVDRLLSPRRHRNAPRPDARLRRLRPSHPLRHVLRHHGRHVLVCGKDHRQPRQEGVRCSPAQRSSDCRRHRFCAWDCKAACSSGISVTRGFKARAMITFRSSRAFTSVRHWPPRADPSPSSPPA